MASTAWTIRRGICSKARSQEKIPETPMMIITIAVVRALLNNTSHNCLHVSSR